MIMKRFNLKIILLLLVILIFGFTTKAQQFKPNTEIGILLGASYYLGDLNTTHFNQSLATAGLVIRRNIDQRFVYKAEAMYINLKSDERGSKDTIANNRSLHFRSPVYEVSGQLEFNFLPYEKGNSLYPWTPFVFTGVSIFNYNPKAEASDGIWYELQPLGTEGQETTLRSYLKKYSLTQLCLPFGGGIKVSINKDFNVILEHGLRKTFTDYLDDVSTTYAGIPAEFDNITIELADRSLDGPKQAGEARGNSRNNDWYSFTTITISFTINQNKKGCDYD